MMSRCVCGHPADRHDHYRDGSDCGQCGSGRCPWYIALADRIELAGLMTTAQRLALAESDAHFYRNLSHLAEYNPGYRDRMTAADTQPIRARVPAQRKVPTIRAELEARRVRAAARARNNREGSR
jgi:hypothetical protein